MKRFGLFLAGAVGVFSSELPILMEWEEWKAHFEGDRLFTASGLEHERKSQFEANIEKIKSHNARHANGEVGYTLGVNQFADLSPEEFGDIVGLTQSAKNRPVRTAPRNPVELDVSDTPTSVDWRSKGGVTAVKNQGQCGSCWSFSSTGAMEGNLFAQTGTLMSLSEKMLMDCSTENHSCNGGLMDYAFQFVISNGGIDTEADYPYQPQDGTCDRTKEAKHAAKFTGFHDVTKNNVDQMKAAVALNPVSVAIEADKEAFQLYRSGVLDSEACGTQLDHGVLVVGYTTEDDATYPNAWIVKNSWAATWGVAGYIYISRTTQYSPMGICGILQDPSYPTGGSVGPAPPTPTPGSEFYENPYIVHECGDNEAPLTLSTAGKLCSPKCTVDADCPANPSGFSGTPRCSITDAMTQQKYCAIECNYSQAECGSSGGADTSHGGAECEVYCDGSATGCQWMCLYQGADWKTSLVERINREQVQIALE